MYRPILFLTYPPTNNCPSSVRLPEVVDWVFSTLVQDEERAQSNGPVKSNADQSNSPVKSTAVVVMRDMLLGTLEHMDKLTGQGLGQGLGSGQGSGPGLEVSSLLRVMLAITQRLLPVPAPLSLPLSVPLPRPVSEPQSSTPTNTPTSPIYPANSSPLGVGVLKHARASLLAFHRSLRVLQGQGLEAQGQGLEADTGTGNNIDKNDNDDNNMDNDNRNDNDSDNDDGSPPPAAATSIALQLLLDILPRACTQLTSPHLPHQVLALACVRACFERLALQSPAKVAGVLNYLQP